MKQFFRLGLAFLVLIHFIFLTVYYFDGKQIGSGIIDLLKHPYLLIIIWIVYFFSFCLKAFAWQLYFKRKVRFSTCLLGILYSLLVNHLFPIKVGDIVRAKVLSIRDKNLKDEESFHSVIILRLLDMFCLVVITFTGLLNLNVNFTIPVWSILVGLVFCVIVFLILLKYFPAFLRRQLSLLINAFSGRNGFMIIFITFLSWILEGSILYGVVLSLKGELTFLDTVFANSITIAGQVFQMTPGGIGNYESFLVFALGLFGFPLTEGYTIAVISHFMKFLFSYLVGVIIILIYPISFNKMNGWVRVKGVIKK